VGCGQRVQLHLGVAVSTTRILIENSLSIIKQAQKIANEAVSLDEPWSDVEYLQRYNALNPPARLSLEQKIMTLPYVSPGSENEEGSTVFDGRGPVEEVINDLQGMGFKSAGDRDGSWYNEHFGERVYLKWRLEID